MAAGDRLAGKVAIVTGGASGIGEAIVRRFRAEGAEVMIADHDAARGEAVAADCGACFHPLDVADEAGWSALAETIRAGFGRLDVLVNNAGIVSHQSIAETTLESWRRVIDVNLTGTMLGCRSAVAAMRANPGGAAGSIVNLGSTTSFLGLANDLVYTTTKAGVVGLTRSVATWCAREGLAIRCNSLHPGATRTAILEAVFAEQPEVEAKVAAMSPRGSIASPDEVAALALFLASDDSIGSTGAQFVVDGGLTAAHPAM
jgi:NAD(P)-dependent dehydrogenase (short-subunit alcohol dehydrogenase family)